MMSKKLKKEDKSIKETPKRFLDAKKDFQKIQEEIAPFIRRRKFKAHSTAGEWCQTSTLYL